MFCDLKRRMIVDLHQQSRRCSHFPCMVAEGLPQGVASYHIFDPYGLGGFADNAVGLVTGERGICFSGAGKEVVCVSYGRLCFPVGQQCFLEFSIDQDPGLFSCFLFYDRKVSVKVSAFRTIDVALGEMKDVTYAECSVQTDQDKSVVAEIRMYGEIVVLEIV